MARYEAATTEASAESPEDVAAFVQLCVDGLTVCVRGTRHNELKTAFLSAFEHRRQYSWLGEAGELPSANGDGLAFALAYALAVYSPDDLATARVEDNAYSAPESTYEDLAAAVNNLPSFGTNISQFAASLERAGMKVEKINDVMLAPHLVAAIRHYVAESGRQPSSDPW